MRRRKRRRRPKTTAGWAAQVKGRKSEHHSADNVSQSHGPQLLQRQLRQDKDELRRLHR